MTRNNAPSKRKFSREEQYEASLRRQRNAVRIGNAIDPSAAEPLLLSALPRLRTLGDITQYTHDEIAAIPGIDRIALWRIGLALAARNLSFKDREPDVRPPS